ncbi:MAG: hypothetical protein ACPK85_04150 [Methanosarcina sp.]
MSVSKSEHLAGGDKNPKLNEFFNMYRTMNNIINYGGNIMGFFAFSYDKVKITYECVKIRAFGWWR